MSYQDFKLQFEATHGPLQQDPPWWEQARNRQYRPPEPPEGPVSTIVNGLTQEEHVVPRVTDDETPEAPVRKRRKRQTSGTGKKFFCDPCRRWVPAKEAKAGHKHDFEKVNSRGKIPASAKYPRQPQRRPQQMNSRHKPVNYRVKNPDAVSVQAASAGLPELGKR
jgi:hypothetical protein